MPSIDIAISVIAKICCGDLVLMVNIVYRWSECDGNPYHMQWVVYIDITSFAIVVHVVN